MKTAIAKWGNSLAIRIPKSEILEKGLEEGSVVEVSLKTVKNKRPTLKELLAMIGPEGNPHEEIDWGPPLGKEVW